MFGQNMTEITKRWMKPYLQQGDTVVDATAGNGYDTVFLAEQVGIDGQVYAFDLQEEALLKTKDKLRALGLEKQVRLIHSSHAQMKDWVNRPIAGAMFNLGYLPRGDKNVITRRETTLEALDQALNLLKKEGVISILSYDGHTGGLEEKEGVKNYIKKLDAKYYEVIEFLCLNREQPPSLYMIKKIR